MKIAVLLGDDTGPEIVAETVKILKALVGPIFDLEERPVGGPMYDLSSHP